MHSSRLYILFFLLIPIFSFSQRTKELRRITERIVRYDTKINHEKTPGFIAGMIDVDSTYIVDFGSASKTEDIRINQHTIFEIGSLTKVFTASLVTILKNEGHFSYDDYVNDLIPPIYQNKVADSLQLKHLLMHTSGLPLLPSDFGLKEKRPNDPYAFYTKDDVLGFYSTYPFNKPVGEYLYSHVNFALLEIIIEHVCKESYETLLQEKIITPLSLNETFLGVNEKLLKNASKSYGPNGRETMFWSFQSFEGSLGLKSSLHDLLILIRTYMGLQNEEYTALFQETFQERQPTELAQELDINYAWHEYHHKKYFNVKLHPGRSSGHQVTIHFIPETKTGVIILANSTASLDNLGYMMLALVNNHWKLRKKDKKIYKKGKHMVQ